jgi:hypothetical protein
MISVGIGIPFGRRGGGFTAEYKAILARATALGYTLPSARVQILQNSLVKALINGGVWSELDHFKVYSGSNDNFSLINWINPLANLSTKANSPTYDYAGGWAGNATTAHLQTNFIPSGSANYRQNDACYFRYRRTERTIGQTQNYMGAFGNNRNALIGSHGASSYEVYMNTLNANLFTAGVTTLGMNILNRNNSANYDVWLNNVKIQTPVQASVNIPIDQFLTCKLSITNASNAQISCEGAGGALSDAQIAVLTNSFDTYLAAI